VAMGDRIPNSDRELFEVIRRSVGELGEKHTQPSRRGVD
jgi:hypothetical protein